MKKWTHWLFEKNSENRTRLIGDSKSLIQLNRVLGNVEAFEAFDSDGVSLKKAIELTEDLDQIFANALRSSLKYLEDANGLIHRIDDFNADCRENLKSIMTLARHMDLKDRFKDEY